MSSKSLPTIELDCRPPATARLAALLACVTATLIPLLVIPSPWNVMASLACAVFVLWACIHSGSLGGIRAVRQAYLSADGLWWITDGGGLVSRARLRADSRVFAHWLWLRWDSPLGLRQVVLFRDSPQATNVRRVVVRLRLLGGLTDASPDGVSL